MLHPKVTVRQITPIPMTILSFLAQRTFRDGEKKNSLDKTRLYLFTGEKRDANLKQYQKETFITFI